MELEQRLVEGAAGSVKHYAALRLLPLGTTIELDTVLLYRLQQYGFSAGLSHDLSVNTWTHNLRYDLIGFVRTHNFRYDLLGRTLL